MTKKNKLKVILVAALIILINAIVILSTERIVFGIKAYNHKLLFKEHTRDLEQTFVFGDNINFAKSLGIGNNIIIDTVKGNRAVDNESVLKILNAVRDKLNASIVYVMNLNGKVVASTNYEKNKSITGFNYSFRPYFQQALSEEQFTYAALGVTTNKRGIYYSAPVYDRFSKKLKVVGVIVIKQALKKVDNLLKQFPGVSFLVTPHNVIFSSSDPSYLFSRAVTDVLGEDEDKFQFNEEIKKLPFKLNSKYTKIDSNKYYLYRESINLNDYLGKWKFYQLVNYSSWFSSSKLFSVLAITNIALVAIIFIVIYNRKRVSRLAFYREKRILVNNRRLSEAISERNKDIGEFLDNIELGILQIDKKLKIVGEYSNYCLKIFQKQSLEGREILELLALNEDDKSNCESVFIQMFDDTIPEDILLERLPKLFNLGRRYFSLKIRVIRNENESVKTILFNIADITKSHDLFLTNIKNERLIEVLKQKTSFYTFLIDMKELIASSRHFVINHCRSEVLYCLSSMKEYAEMYSLDPIDDTIKSIILKSDINLNDITEVEYSIRNFLDSNMNILSIDFDKLDDYLIRFNKKSLNELKNINKDENSVEKWIYNIDNNFESSYLIPLKYYAKKLSLKLKKKVNLKYEGDFFLDKLYAPVFRNLVHLVKNSMLYGIKNSGVINIMVAQTDKEVILTFSDDGAGIDMDVLCEKLMDKNVITSEEFNSLDDNKRLHLIFKNKITTSKNLSELIISGTGTECFSMSVYDIGGNIEYINIKDKGLTIIARMPIKKANI